MAFFKTREVGRRQVMRSSLEVIELGLADIDEVMELEQRVCTPLIQAQKETVCNRLELGNIMLGVRMGALLVGSIGFRYSNFYPDSLESFPKTFGEFSTPTKKPTDYNAGFCYSVNVDPELRTLAVYRKTNKGLRPTGVGKALMVGMVERATKDGCTWLVGDGRPAFYNGSFDFPHERYEQDLKLKAILDECAAENRQPTNEEKENLLNYPIFRAYSKAIGGGLQLAWIIRNFFPRDIPAGGFRVIVYKRLK